MGGTVAGEAPTAFEDFYREHWSSAIRLAAAITRSAAAGEDIAQEVFQKMYRSWGTADEPAVAQETPIETRGGEVRPVTSRERFAWWRRTLAGLLGGRDRTRRDTTRECAPDPTAGQSSAESGRWLAAEQTTPLATVPQGEAARVAHALAALPDGQREAVVLRYHHGYSVAATAA